MRSRGSGLWGSGGSTFERRACLSLGFMLGLRDKREGELGHIGSWQAAATELPCAEDKRGANAASGPSMRARAPDIGFE